MILSETKDRGKYETLKEKDEKDQQVIAQELLRTTSLYEEIRKFQNKITAHNAMSGKEISEILGERDFFQKIYWTLKNCFLSGAYHCLFP